MLDGSKNFVDDEEEQLFEGLSPRESGNKGEEID
jgi:hypothetical protein